MNTGFMIKEGAAEKLQFETKVLMYSLELRKFGAVENAEILSSEIVHESMLLSTLLRRHLFRSWPLTFSNKPDRPSQQSVYI